MHDSYSFFSSFYNNESLSNNRMDLSSFIAEEDRIKNEYFDVTTPNGYLDVNPTLTSNSYDVVFKENTPSNDATSKLTRTTPEETKKPKHFVIITSRKLNPDSILKKINCLFYSWLNSQLNSLKKGLKFNKFSSKTIKEIRKKEVLAIMNTQLKDLLEKDKGSEKYKDATVNARAIEKINTLTDDSYEKVKQQLERTVDDFYQDFSRLTLHVKGPPLYQNKFEAFHKNYKLMLQGNYD